MAEVWLPVIDYEGIYEVSNHGRIRRDFAAPARSLGVPGRILTPCSGPKGYLLVTLSKAGIVTTKRLHKIVLSAFCGDAPFSGAHAAHNDGDKQNCRLDNLRWATPAENQADRVRHKTDIRGSDVFGAVLCEAEVSEIRKRINGGERNPSIASDYGVSISTIHLIRHNRTWRHVA